MKHLRILIDEYTTPCPATVGPEATLGDVARIMDDFAVRHVPVVAGGQPIGILSDRDVRMVTVVPGGSEIVAGEVMNRDLFAVSSGALLESTVLEMSRRKIGSAIVTENGRLSGIFTSTDALNALVEILRGDVNP